MSGNCREGSQSSLIMHDDPKLPPGWKRKVVKRLRGDRYDVYILSPTWKRFRSGPQLQEYLEKNPQLGLTIDQFSFSPKPGMTKRKPTPKPNRALSTI